MIVHFVNIGGIVEYHCLNLLFMVETRQYFLNTTEKQQPGGYKLLKCECRKLNHG